MSGDLLLELYVASVPPEAGETAQTLLPPGSLPMLLTVSWLSWAPRARTREEKPRAAPAVGPEACGHGATSKEKSG